MIIAITMIVVAIIGIVMISVVITSIIGHFFIKGCGAITSRLISQRHPKKDTQSGYQGDYNNHETNMANIPIYQQNMSTYDPYEAIHRLTSTRRKQPSKVHIGNLCTYQKTNGNKKNYYRYYKRFILNSPPMEHIRGIVNRLRRGVNESGKEPPSVEP